MEPRTLLVSAYHEPIKVVPWWKAVMWLFAEDQKTGKLCPKVEVLVEYDEELRSPSFTMKTPAVVKLVKHIGPMKRGVKFSRINVFQRDSFRCQYCGHKFLMKDLNYDHVLPRDRGGRTNFENIVTSCYPCNERKGNRTPEEAGMRLLKKPYKPKSLPMFAPVLRVDSPPPEWEGWLREETVQTA